MEEFFKSLQELAHQEWVFTVVIGVLIIAVTVVIAKICVLIIRRVITSKSSHLPANSIFINLVRIAVWTIGIGILLTVCFNVNVAAVITALGIGGIAVSLGFQATLSNLIGGLEVSVSRVIKPGDRVKIGTTGAFGTVSDVSWRHTVITDDNGNQVIVPNSLVNNQTLMMLPPMGNITIPIIVNTTSERLTVVAHQMEKACSKAISRVSHVKDDPSIAFTEIVEFGFKGNLSFTISDDDRANFAIDAAIRAIAPYAHLNTIAEVADAVEGVTKQQQAQNKLVEETVESGNAVAVIAPTKKVVVASGVPVNETKLDKKAEGRQSSSSRNATRQSEKKQNEAKQTSSDEKSDKAAHEQQAAQGFRKGDDQAENTPVASSQQTTDTGLSTSEQSAAAVKHDPANEAAAAVFQESTQQSTQQPMTKEASENSLVSV